MIRILIFISIFIFIVTFTIVFFHTKNDMEKGDYLPEVPQAIETQEQTQEPWTRVEGPDYNFSFPADWHWREYIDVDGVAVRFITNDETVERLGQEVKEDQIAMSFWTEANDISDEALKTMSPEEINERALDAELERARQGFEIKGEEKLLINENQTVTYLFEDEGLKYRKYFIVNEKRFSFITAEYANDEHSETIKKIMDSFELKRE
jgi:hypothetical protein